MCRIVRHSPKTGIAVPGRDVPRELFGTTVRRCVEEDLVCVEGFAVHPSLITADATKQRSAIASERVERTSMPQSRRAV